MDLLLVVMRLSLATGFMLAVAVVLYVVVRFLAAFCGIDGWIPDSPLLELAHMRKSMMRRSVSIGRHSTALLRRSPTLAKCGRWPLR